MNLCSLFALLVLLIACEFAVIYTRRIIQQLDAPQDLALISWPPDKLIPWADDRSRVGCYICDDDRGHDMYIYLIDSGVNLQNPVREFSFLP